jgi:hypothetical protein
VTKHYASVVEANRRANEEVRVSRGIVSGTTLNVSGPPVATNSIALGPAGPSRESLPTVVDSAKLTDGGLLEFGRSKRDGTATDAMWRHVVCVALGLTLEHDEGQNVASARKRIAMQVEHDAKYGIGTASGGPR